MLEYAFARGIQRRMFLYWGVRRPEDLYLRELPERWAREHANFTFVPVISGLVHEKILADFADLAGYQVYACGSAGMVQAVHPAFTAHGLGPDDCFSDAFVPRLETVRLGGAA
jgi:NAD(P)H-flavin reductase